MKNSRKSSKRKEEQKKSNLFCSFCGKPQAKVRKMVAGPDAIICDDCIQLCVEMLIESGLELNIPTLREKYNSAKSIQLDIEKLGIKPRFTKLKFEQRVNHCFFLSPIKEPFNSIYKDHVVNAVRKQGFTIERADEVYGTQPIIEDIWEAINSASIIIADVTQKNPNVMYEIGMAHTVGKPVLIITQEIEDVPFDLRHYRCIVYEYTPRGCKVLEEKISGTLRFLNIKTK